VTTMTDTAAKAAIAAAAWELHLPTVRAEATRLAEVAQRNRLSYLAFLAEIVAAEVDDRAERRRERRIHEARFPRIKRLADFDLAAAPTVNPATIATLANGSYLDAGDPVVLFGESGTGKSHLVIGLGIAACEQGRRVRYVTCAQLVNELVEAADERRLSRIVVRCGRLDLLCLDELGCAPRGADGPWGMRGPPPVVAATGRS
jgi:DNA replication protein DnaC